PAIFEAFDENRDGSIDFKEFACGISAACRGPQIERYKCKPNNLFHCWLFINDINMYKKCIRFT
ncbi:unnamed protein product, partial [Rotaria socialis]